MGGSLRANCARTSDALISQADPGLHGRLSLFPAWEVLQWFAQRAAEGVLTLSSATDQEPQLLELHVRDGIVVAVAGSALCGQPPVCMDNLSSAAPQSDRIGGVLIGRGDLGIPQLRFGLALQLSSAASGHPHTRIGELLVQCGCLSSSALTAGLRAWAMQRVGDVCGWTDGSFAYRMGPPQWAGVGVGEPLEPLLLQSVAQLDPSAVALGTALVNELDT